MAKKKTTYCETRLEQYGITEQWNTLKVQNYKNPKNEKLEKYKTDEDRAEEKKTRNKQITFFEPTENDDIQINFLNLYGGVSQYVSSDSRFSKRFCRLRINPARVKDDVKYSQPPKSGVHIHLNPSIIKKFQDGIKIKTLFMVEGEFKHWTGFMNGLDIVGLPSIHAYKEKDSDLLHETIREIIRVCQVEDLVMIYDADINSVKWEKWEKDDTYDLGKRANMFYSSARNIRDYAKKLVTDVYICNIAVEYLNKFNGKDSVKGLDDLFLYHKGKENEVVDELKKLRSSQSMFTYMNITGESPGKIRDFFRLRRDKQGRPEQFYNLHQSRLAEKEFTFLGFKYKYNNIEETLEVVRHPDSEKFIRVACDYIKIITIPEIIRGIKVVRRKLEPWKTGELSRDYVNKGYKNFFDTIRKYDQFSVFPDNTEKYKQVVDNCYNLYYKVPHTPKEGKFPATKMFLEHLFADQIEMAYDYLKLLYTMPWQPLPILALVSQERGTGKTKFLELLREIFVENATILGNDAITDAYNDDYVSKLVIGIDEGLIEKKVTVEKIKSWSTAVRVKMNTKFLSRQEIPFYGHIVITSNNTDSFIQIEDEETRFWIRKIPKVESEDPQLMEKMEKEIPALLHFLNERKFKHKRATRQWFEYALLQTEALTEVKDNSQSWLYKELKTFMEDEFYKYRYHVLCYTLKELMELLNGHSSGAKFRGHATKMELEKKFKIHNYSFRAKFPANDIEGVKHSLKDKQNGRYYQFYIEQFLDYDTIKEIGYNVQTLIEIHGSGLRNVELWPNEKYRPATVQAEIKIEYEEPRQDITVSNSDNPDNLPY